MFNSLFDSFKIETSFKNWDFWSNGERQKFVNLDTLVIVFPSLKLAMWIFQLTAMMLEAGSC